MKITFTGWNRYVYTHYHGVRPISYFNQVGNYGEPMQWHDENECTTYGKVENLALSGNYKVKFEFHPDELKSWLRNYIQKHPFEAKSLLNEMDTEYYNALDKIANNIIEQLNIK